MKLRNGKYLRFEMNSIFLISLVVFLDTTMFVTVFCLGFFLVYELTVNSNSAFGLPSWLSLVAGSSGSTCVVIGASDTPGFV